MLKKIIGSLAKLKKRIFLFKTLKKSFLFSKTEKRKYEEFLSQFELSSKEFIDNPYPVFSYLRSRGAFHFLPKENAWFVVDYDQINNIIKSPDLFSNQPYSVFDKYLLGADPPDHTAIRTLLEPLFSPKAIKKLEQYTADSAAQILDNILEKKSFDVVLDYSVPLTIDILKEFLKLTGHEITELKKELTGPVNEYWNKVKPFFERYLKTYDLGKKDTVAWYLLTSVENGIITFEAALSLINILWVAGFNTTSLIISTTINFTLKYPELKKQLIDDEKLIPKFIEESLRMEAPQSELRRITVQNTVFEGVRFPANTSIILSINAANYDPKYFAEPKKFILNRSYRRHLSFGTGGSVHYCIGMGLAKVGINQALKVILNKASNLQKAYPDQADDFYPSSHFHGLTSLIVKTA